MSENTANQQDAGMPEDCGGQPDAGKVQQSGTAAPDNSRQTATGNPGLYTIQGGAA